MQRRDGPGVFSVRDELIDIAEATATFWHDPDFVPFASVARDGHIENAPIESDAFRLALVAAYGIAHPRRRRDGTLAPAGVGDAALKEAMVALTALARRERPMNRRSAWRVPTVACTSISEARRGRASRSMRPAGASSRRRRSSSSARQVFVRSPNP